MPTCHSSPCSGTVVGGRPTVLAEFLLAKLLIELLIHSVYILLFLANFPAFSDLLGRIWHFRRQKERKRKKEKGFSGVLRPLRPKKKEKKRKEGEKKKGEEKGEKNNLFFFA